MQRWGANAKDTNDACGVTVFDDRGKPPLIFINAEIPCWASVEIISHEVAHVAAGVNAGHGKIWQAEFDKIYDAYCSAHKAIESEL
jgi:hypothetical protein